MDHDLARYHRQVLLAGFGEAGQRRLRDSTVLVLGCGALGCIAADLLARAGVGRLVIVDRDFVERSNLQRQLLFDEADAAEALPKAVAARRRLGRINSDLQVTAIVDDVHHANIERHAAGADVIVDGLDNFETRYLANDLAVKTARPYVYGAAVAASGMAFAVLPRGSGEAPWESLPGGSLATPCLRCLFPEPPPPGESPTCDTVGVLGPVVVAVASFQVAETLKILTGNYASLSRRLLHLDLWENDLQALGVSGAGEAPPCPCCGGRRFDYLDGRAGGEATALCGRDAVQLRPRRAAGEIELEAVANRLRPLGPTRCNEFLLRVALDDGGRRYQLTLFRDGRAIVHGTDRPEVARSLYARFVGD